MQPVHDPRGVRLFHFRNQPRSRQDVLHLAWGLLAWLVRGAVSWYDRGLGAMPEAIGAAFDSYKEENDTLAAFLADRCTAAPDATCNAAAFRQAYMTHSGQHVQQKDLKHFMKKKGFHFVTTGSMYKGVRLSADMS